MPLKRVLGSFKVWCDLSLLSLAQRMCSGVPRSGSVQKESGIFLGVLIGQGLPCVATSSRPWFAHPHLNT